MDRLASSAEVIAAFRSLGCRQLAESPAMTMGAILWTVFGAVVVVLALDLGVFHRKAHEIGFREAAQCVVWI